MKKLIYTSTVVLFLLLLSSCLTTFYPIFTEKDVVFNTALLGYWKCTDKGNNISFMEFKRIPDNNRQELSPEIRKLSDKGYLVSRLNSKEEIISQHFVFLAKIGKHYYLDYYPAEMASEKTINQFYRDHSIKLHSNYRCDFKDTDHFEIKLFDQSFLDKLIADNKINIRHEVIDGDNLITASTADLQKFITQYSDNPDAFGGDLTSCSRINNR